MTNPDTLYRIFREHPSVTTDTRNILPGSIFFALKGEQFDGNAFAAEAIAKGACCAVVDNPEMTGGHPYILVPNVLESLQSIARIHREHLNATVIGITGTNGKTTTKELLGRVLGSAFDTLCTSGNLNNHIGVPLTLLSLTGKTRFAVVEMGANHPGEIASLCQIADPDYGLITNIGKAHLEGFGSLQGIIRTKSELYMHLAAKGGTAFVNIDHAVLVKQSASLNIFTYGKKSGADVRGKITGQSPFLRITWSYQGKQYQLESSLYGNYNFENILAAIAVGLFFGVSPEKINSSIASYIPGNNRSQVIKTLHGNTVILDAYNANPTSMASALKSFGEMDAASKLLIMGDMLELGPESESEHKAILALAEKLEFDRVILVGDIFSHLPHPPGWKSFKNAAEAKAWMQAAPPANSAILVKGSRKIRLESLSELF